ncbi:MAG: hypothetical protein K1X74_09745 [Pirellulales bacterium]|nr:hypothetical protein [Pirellulales bacterium]
MALSPCANAQRVTFPSPVAEAPGTPAPYAPPYAQQYAPPGTPQYLPPGTPPTYTPPGATLPGTIQAPTPQWDIYGDPALQPPTLAPQQNYFTQPSSWLPASATKFLQEIRIQQTYIYGNGGLDVEMNDTDLAATFAVPLFGAPQPFLITPGFSLHLWDGPETPPGGGPDLPAQIYDAYLDTAWRPQFSPTVGADLGFRIGAYTDFSYFDNHSMRFLGRGLGVLTLNQAWQLTAGIVYLDRNNVKLLPAGGVIWTPDPDTRYELVFPYPKLSERLTTVGNTDLWLYLAGEYGGGSWTITRASGTKDSFDLNDIRIRLGIEWLRFQGPRGWAEIGYVFNREIKYEVDPTDFDPGDTFMIRAGVAF